MGKKGILAIMSCAFALCLALVGCGGGNDEAAAKAAFTGTWDLVEMSQDGEVTSSDDIEMLKSLGLEVYVNLNEDGTAALVLFGESIDGTWEASSATAGKITFEDEAVDMKISDSKLSFEQEGSSLVFEKGEAKEAPSAGASSETASTAASDEAASDEAASDEAASDEAASDEAASSSAAAA